MAYANFDVGITVQFCVKIVFFSINIEGRPVARQPASLQNCHFTSNYNPFGIRVPDLASDYVKNLERSKP